MIIVGTMRDGGSVKVQENETVFYFDGRIDTETKWMPFRSYPKHKTDFSGLVKQRQEMVTVKKLLFDTLMFCDITKYETEFLSKSLELVSFLIDNS